MTRSAEACARAEETIRQITVLWDEAYLAQRVDDPVEKVLHEFEIADDSASSHVEFHRIIAAFVRRLYQEVPSCGRMLSPSQAHDEAIALLEQAYGPMGGNGYDDAVLEAADPAQPGLILILALLAETVKMRWRERYLRWITARHIDPSDWHMKCAMAALLVRHCRQWMPPASRHLLPEQLVDSLPELLSIHLTMNPPTPSLPTQSTNSR